MMRSAKANRIAIIVGSLVALVVPRAEAVPPQPLSTTSVMFDAPVPCGALCPYVVDSHVELLEPTLWPRMVRDPAVEACRPTPLALPMSWHDITVQVPDQIEGRVPTHLIFEIYPITDHDAFLCTVTDPGTPQEIWQPVRGQCYYCGLVWPECYVGGFHTGFGCEEWLGTEVAPGMTIVMRVFNQADFTACPGRYRFFG